MQHPLHQTELDKTGRSVSVGSTRQDVWLRALAEALGIPAGELLPNTVMSAIEADTAPMLEIKQAAGHPDRVFIRVNRMVTLDQAAAIFNIIKESK